MSPLPAARVDLAAGLRAETRAIDPPADLLDHLGANGFAWFGDDVSFVTAGAVAEVEPAAAGALLAAVDHDADVDVAARGPLAVGALPFSGRGRLVVPARVVGIDARGAAWSTTIGHRVATAVGRHAPATRYEVEAVSDGAAWAAAVDAVLRAIDDDRVRKVVLAREVRVRADTPFDVVPVLARLRRTQPGCIVFADGGFVGATPELLVARRGVDVICRPMAGTVARDVDAATLLASRKDGFEHDEVAAAVVRELRDRCTGVAASEPVTASFADVTHLVTHVHGRLRDHATSALDLARALHPTPAVAGTPRDEALHMIRQLEPTARGNYAGPVGWVDGIGDGEFAVALRCAALDGCSARLHAGAGIVAGSDPAAEWEETSVKLEPMLRALVRP